MQGEPLVEAAARKLVRDILLKGRVTFTGHAREEMEKDDLSEVDVVNVLRAGLVRFPELVKGTWRYRAFTRRMAVIFAFRSREELTIVTAWRIHS